MHWASVGQCMVRALGKRLCKQGASVGQYVGQVLVRASIGSGQAAASLCRLGQHRSVSQAVVPPGTSGAVCFAFVYKYQMKIEIQKSVHVVIEMEHILYLVEYICHQF